MAGRRASPDMLAGVALAALGAYVAAQASRWELMGEDGPGPGFFPFGYGVLILALSALLVLRAAFSRTEATPAAEAGANRRALLTWAAFAGSALAMPWIGFVLGFALLSAFVAAFVFGRGWRTAAAVGLGCAGGFWLVFGQVLGVGLPVGPWGF